MANYGDGVAGIYKQNQPYFPQDANTANWTKKDSPTFFFLSIALVKVYNVFAMACLQLQVGGGCCPIRNHCLFWTMFGVQFGSIQYVWYHSLVIHESAAHSCATLTSFTRHMIGCWVSGGGNSGAVTQVCLETPSVSVGVRRDLMTEVFRRF